MGGTFWVANEGSHEPADRSDVIREPTEQQKDAANPEVFLIGLPVDRSAVAVEPMLFAHAIEKGRARWRSLALRLFVDALFQLDVDKRASPGAECRQTAGGFNVISPTKLDRGRLGINPIP
jgi:hypothetical protein